MSKSPTKSSGLVWKARESLPCTGRMRLVVLLSGKRQNMFHDFKKRLAKVRIVFEKATAINVTEMLLAVPLVRACSADSARHRGSMGRMGI